MNKKDRLIILIGGAPTTGKSTMAQLVAKQFQIPWISSDQIRDIMRNASNRTLNPSLFDPEGYSAEQFLTEFSASKIAEMEMKQSEAVWPGIKMFIETDYTWENGFVLEGVNLLPHLIAKDFSTAKNVHTVFLVDDDANKIREVIYSRGLWDDANTYADSVKEKEVEWVIEFNQKILAEAQQFGFPCIKATKQGNDLATVLSVLRVKSSLQ